MPANDYHFVSQWTAPGATVEEVFAVISDVEALPQWWPSVYLAVTPLPGTTYEGPIGRQFDLITKGWLPYTLKWTLTVAQVHPPLSSTILASGDFEGRGIWTFHQAEEGVEITFDWQLLAEKPLIKLLSPVLRPAFAANHRWAMEQGQISLLRELERRRGARSLPPPRPTTWEPFAALAALVGALGLALYLINRLCGKKQNIQ